MYCMTTPTKKQKKIEIRYIHEDTHKGFKRVAADFDNYEHVVLWLIENYESFKSIRPPSTVPSNRMKMMHGVL